MNITAFGELFLIVKHIKKEPYNLSIWAEMHPRIRSIASSLYKDGHFGAAAEKAIKEVEQRLRDIFREAKPTSKEPKEAADIVGALLSERGAYRVADDTTPSGKSYCRGIKLLFDGFLASYRNPSCHGNREFSKREAVEQIVLASQLMYALEGGSVVPNSESPAER
ncbi:TIGR02391 family protein [Adlercreutzia sp. ZJ304]|uniref:TIGR02391 family protein n=1 Tax=Adlercreutzia sp. ZJ304 TaxID=2709791 RepID=UPI0013EBA339|nr:TIGR02391 family protein [Adlercreutzia sp. ZJ304]